MTMQTETAWIIEGERIALTPIGAGWWIAQAPYDIENDRERDVFKGRSIDEAVAKCYADLKGAK